MNLNFAWLLMGLTTALAIQSLDLSSDSLQITLPFSTLALSIGILILGTRAGGLEFLRDMVVPVELGVFYTAALPLILGSWLGLANRLLARPVSLFGFIGQSAIILSAGLLFWRHSGIYPIWTAAGLACYSALSTRPGGRRVLP